MSEVLTGEHAQERPGMNAGGGNEEQSKSSKPKRHRNRRNRRRKPKDKSEQGIQADTNAPADPLETKERPANQSVDGKEENKDVFQPNKRKRARRRGKNSGKNRDKNRENAPKTAEALNGADGNQKAQSKSTHKVKDNRHKNGPFKKQRHHRPDAYAALDLGTNNCRLLVAVPQQPGRFKVVDAFSRIVRLGEGLTKSGRLSDLAMDRAVGALKACAGKLKNRNVRGVRLIATEACRQAENGAEFLQRVEDEAGLKLEIIDRETEAKLAVAGCTTLVDRKASGVVLFDIGGGSSELALLDLRKKRNHDLSRTMVSWTSLPHGVVTLSERHGDGKLVTREIFEAMVDEVSELLEGFEGRDALEEAAKEGEIHLLGTSGTVTTLAGIHLKLPRYDRRQVDGIWMDSAQVDAMIDALVDMSFEERVANPCIGADRADLVLAGCAILVAIQRVWPCPRLRVADRGLREGLLTQMMNADNAWQRRPRHHRSRNKRPQNRNP